MTLKTILKNLDETMVMNICILTNTTIPVMTAMKVRLDSITFDI